MLKVAVIGVGNMGLLHCRIFSGLPYVKLVAICDSNESKAEKIAKLYDTKFYLNYKQLLAEEKLDGVSIAVPTSLHHEVALLCIKHGINIMVEKPLAQSVNDAAAIIKATKKRRVILMVGHVERFNPAVLKLKEMISRGVFGEIVSIVVKRVGLYPPHTKDVNVVTDLAVHDLDIVCDLLNKLPNSVFATGGNGINRHQVDYADILLNFGKTSCYLQVNWLTPIKIRSLSITGTSGYGELDFISQELVLYKSKSKILQSLPISFDKFTNKLGKSQKISIKIKKEEPLRIELEHFVKSITKKQKPKVAGEDGMRAVRLSEMVLKSLSKRQMIEF